MKRINRFLVAWSAIFLAFVGSTRGDDRLENTIFRLEVARKEIENQAGDQRKDLFEKYAAAIGRIQQSFQKSGDLENMLNAGKEMELAKLQEAPGEVQFPGADEIRATLDRALGEIDQAEQARLGTLAETYLEALKTLQEDLTRQGQIDDALATRKLIQELSTLAQAQEQPGEETEKRSAGPTEGGTEKLKLVSKEFPDSILHSTQKVFGSHALEPGRYRGFERMEMGDYAIKNPDENRGEIRIPPGCELSEGVIFGNIGAIDISRSYCHDMEFWQNLHSNFTAEFSLFDRCHFKKAGSWTARVSSRWVFNDCVIVGSFFREWSKKMVGVQARFCTFDDIHFPTFAYLEDAGEEAISEWWVYERCLFRNCIIPESMLIGTEECVFENCEIQPDPLIIQTRISVNLYERGDPLKLPPEQDKVTFRALPESRLSNRQKGSSVAYRYSGKSAEPVVGASD